MKKQVLGNQWDCRVFKSAPMFFNVLSHYNDQRLAQIDA